MDSYTPEYQYSIDEFVGHFDHFVRSPVGTNRAAMMRYFLAHYPDREEARYKMDRFGVAFSYLLRHRADFEQFAVVSDRKFLVTEPLVVALARYFGPIPKEHLHEEPDVDLITSLAMEES